ncbi:MAG TPA: cation:proton antiporter, partial [Longimicrobiaceae bacterium]|nr:cation:proton antiporter [Longimicrobiaceae bacterium]
MDLLTLLVQVGVVLAVARLVGLAFRRIHQPQVVGEMVAGIMLGPSLLGWAAPGLSARLFPPESLASLGLLSQVGLLLFMFLVGLEFDTKLLRGRGHTAVVTSHVSIVVPFVLGAALALFLYPRLSDRSIGFTGFALFMGSAMSVTAFPVLARILTERNLLRTRLGAVTIACAAVDDVTAWSILAVVVAVVRAGSAEVPPWVTLAGSAVYVGLMLTLVRRALGALGRFARSRGRVTQDLLAVVLLLLLASAWTTERLGIHALFGAFLLGAVMPRERALVRGLTEKLEDATVVFFLPLFFAFTGLRTRIGLVEGAEMWLYCGLILLVAVAGKFGGSALSARATGLGWREAGALGVLMNTRGLMELVILTIGLELGVISPALFAMMVVMALATTFMTTPLLELIYPARLIRREAVGQLDAPGEHVTLVAVSLPSAGPGLVRAAAALAPRGGGQRLYALHLERAAEQPLVALPAASAPAYGEALRPAVEAAESAGVDLHPIAFASGDAGRDILEVADARGADLVLMGWHKPVFGRSILGGTVHRVMSEARAEVAVYLERRPDPWRRVLVLYRSGLHDRAAAETGRRIARAGRAEVELLQVVEPGGTGDGAPEPGWAAALAADGVRLRMLESGSPEDAAVEEARRGYDLVVVGASGTWGMEPSAFGARGERLARETGASLLIVRGYAPAEEARGAAAGPRRSPG